MPSTAASAPLLLPHRRWPWQSLALLLLLVYLALAASGTLWDREESRFAVTVTRLIQSPDQPLPGDETTIPVVAHHLARLLVGLLGPLEIAFRGLSILATALAGVLTWRLGRDCLGREAGRSTGLILVASPLVVAVGTAAAHDALFMAASVILLWSFHRDLRRGASRGGFLAMVIGSAVTLLSKSLLGLLPVLAAVVFCIYRRHRPEVGPPLHRLLLATAIGAIAFVAWVLGGDGDHWERFLAPLDVESSGWGWPTTIVLLLAGTWPWVHLLPGMVSALLGGRLLDRQGRAWLCVWTLVFLIAAGLMPIRAIHLTLPVFPVLAVGAGTLLGALHEGRLDEVDRIWLRRGWWLVLPAGIAASMVALIGPWLVPATGLRLVSTLFGLAILGLSLIVARLARQGRTERAVAMGLTGLPALILGGVLLVLPALETYKLSRPLAELVRAKAPTGPVATCGYAEDSLVFYLNRGPVRNLGPEAVSSWIATHADGVLLIRDREMPLVRDQLPPGAAIFGPMAGFDYNKGRWIEVWVVAWKARSPGG